MVELRQLHLDLLPLEEMILRLLTHWRNQVKLPRYRVRLLERHNQIYTFEIKYMHTSLYNSFISTYKCFHNVFTGHQKKQILEIFHAGNYSHYIGMPEASQ